MVERETQAITSDNLPLELRQTFERTGPGCAAAETNIGVVHVCHAADRDIASFANKPVWHRWELALMPTAPVIRLNVAIVDDPHNPYRFESFLNIGDDEQDRILELLLTQEQLYFPFHGDDLGYRFTRVVPHDANQRAQLGQFVGQAYEHWYSIPVRQRDFDRAKAEFQWRFPLQIPLD